MSDVYQRQERAQSTAEYRHENRIEHRQEHRQGVEERVRRREQPDDEEPPFPPQSVQSAVRERLRDCRSRHEEEEETRTDLLGEHSVKSGERMADLYHSLLQVRVDIIERTGREILTIDEIEDIIEMVDGYACAKIQDALLRATRLR